LLANLSILSELWMLTKMIYYTKRRYKLCTQ
jgi:hypothetical protein